VAETIKFEDNRQGRPALCLACEEMLADAVDETLSPADQAFFDRHVAGCVDCSRMVAEAQRGAAWLTLLKTPRPEPSAALMERILAQTSGAEVEDRREFAPVVVGQPSLLPVAVPMVPRTNLVAFPGRIRQFAAVLMQPANPYFQPRLAMTAAMAFFSIALTLNLTGVRLDRLNARSLNPSNLKRTYYEANADAVRYCDNLRVVRLMESRVDDLREEKIDRPEPAPEPKRKRAQPEKAEPKKDHDTGGGMSRRELPLDRPKVLHAADAAKVGKGGLA
jgi:hypothetical protein